MVICYIYPLVLEFLFRVHGAFVGDDEVHRVVNDWKSRAEPNYVDEIVSSKQDTGPIPGWSGSESGSSDEQDELI
jgi:S-DNA-T family DNA segregation ATPase FtsK/SpoIIIE